MGVYAIMPNAFDVLYPEFLRIQHHDWKTGLSIAEQLYTPKGSQSVIISGALYSQFHANLNSKNSPISINFLQKTGKTLHKSV